MVSTQIVQQRIAYFQDTTTNQSFMDMHYLLRAKHIENNKFFLVIYDPGLMGVDPRDPTLNKQMMGRILRECLVNFWYFIREVIRIPIEGGAIGSGARYKLHRGNLAMNYLFINNFDMFVDLPRQHFKTVSALCWYLWVFNFGSSNTQMMFINKKHDDAKNNLKTMRRVRQALPDYLQMDSAMDSTGKKVRVPNTAETLQHPSNYNTIKTLPAARSKTMADGAGRGCTMAIQYYDEFAFMPYNSIIYTAAVPAYSRASKNARDNKAPYGMLITTTPGDLTTDEGAYANNMRLNATPWTDDYYDRSYQQLLDLREANENSTFFYIRYTYKQLGSNAEYFKEMIKTLQKDWVKIRREVLIEWSSGAMNCAFRQEDLDIIKNYCRADPLYTMYFGKAGQYQLKIWSQIPITSQYPPIIGVDVAGAQYQDSSAITIIDSQTTRVIATLNCNYIPSPDLAKIVFEIVTKYMKNAIVNVEANGGFGGSVLQLLIKSEIKKNLYYEIKEKAQEERFDGVKAVRKSRMMKKCYGTDNTHDVRNKLIELLHARVANHRDKFIAPILHDELSTMEVKKNGKTEHSSNAHDDQVFSYLMALYVWYFGENLMERFHIMKTEIQTDINEDDDSDFDLEERYGGFDEIDIMNKDDSAESNIVEEQQKIIQASKTMSTEEFYIKEAEKDQDALDKLLYTVDGRKAVAKSLHVDLKYLDEQYGGSAPRDITSDLLSTFYESSNKSSSDTYDGNMADMFRKL